MRFACLSCGAKYSVPDGRLEAAGAAGLRVRCSRCRAIMVVSESQRAVFSGAVAEGPNVFGLRHGKGAAVNEDEDTKKEVRVVRRRSSSSGGGLAVETSGERDVEIPAALSASGVFRPMPGVTRDVTGLFFSDLDTLKREGKPVASRVWYAAIGNRPRGPFSASEIISLAQKGKVREATLVWRPGFSAWKRVKDGYAGGSEDLSWLGNIVSARQRRERDAEERAAARGIASLQVTRTSAGPRSLHGSVHGSAVWSVPDMPALPPDDDDAPPARALPVAPADRLVPFQWRAEETAPRAVGVRRSGDALLWALALSAAAVVVAMVGFEAWKSGLLDQAIAGARTFVASLGGR
ncbi:MAG: zinc-ribbon domain-containing protein [Deltaproteobacteria bacterium]|nr:zinc-ribbon domain-containing protein [Deltaproteobacteria bacterium]